MTGVGTANKVSVNAHSAAGGGAHRAKLGDLLAGSAAFSNLLESCTQDGAPPDGDPSLGIFDPQDASSKVEFTADVASDRSSDTKVSSPELKSDDPSFSVWQMVLMAGEGQPHAAVSVDGAGGLTGTKELDTLARVAASGSAAEGLRSAVSSGKLPSVAESSSLGSRVGEALGEDSASVPTGVKPSHGGSGAHKSLLDGLVAHRPGLDGKSEMLASASGATRAEAREAASAKEGLPDLRTLERQITQDEATNKLSSHGDLLRASGASGPHRDEEKKTTAEQGVGFGSVSMSPSGFAVSTVGQSANADAGQAFNGQRSPEDVVAEQVTYWVNRQRQEASLTLDGGGGQPVSVNISMSGNEASIVFRSDQQQTRDMISGALSELQSLLSREGLVLSGVSVQGGGVGDGRSGSSEAGRSGASKRRIDAQSDSAPVGGVSQRPVTTNRALDLYI